MTFEETGRERERADASLFFHCIGQTKQCCSQNFLQRERASERCCFSFSLSLCPSPGASMSPGRRPPRRPPRPRATLLLALALLVAVALSQVRDEQDERQRARRTTERKMNEKEQDDAGDTDKLNNAFLFFSKALFPSADTKDLSFSLSRRGKVPVLLDGAAESRFLEASLRRMRANEPSGKRQARPRLSTSFFLLSRPPSRFPPCAHAAASFALLHSLVALRLLLDGPIESAIGAPVEAPVRCAECRHQAVFDDDGKCGTLLGFGPLASRSKGL